MTTATLLNKIKKFTLEDFIKSAVLIILSPAIVAHWILSVIISYPIVYTDKAINKYIKQQ